MRIACILTLALLALSICISGCENQADKFYELGIYFEQKEQYGQAVVEFQKALDIDPEHLDAQYHLGLAYRGADMIDEARQALIETLKQKPAHTGALAALGQIAYAAQDSKAAESRARQLLDLDPDNTAGLIIMGGVLVERKDYQGAVRFFERAIKKNKSDAEVHYALAFAYFNVSEPDRTADAIEQIYKARDLGMDITRAMDYFSIELKKRDKTIDDYKAVSEDTALPTEGRQAIGR